MSSKNSTPTSQESISIQPSSGGCPMKQDASSGPSSSWMPKWWRSSSSSSIENNVAAEKLSTVNTASIGGCPVVGGDIGSIPSSIEESARHAQTPQPDQTVPLSIHRATSSIPKPVSKDEAPAHQPHEASRWVYPSEQQFFNAMKRKGWELPPGTELTIPHVVQIHNAVNERGWKEIQEWENLRGNDTPRLVKFIGRPKDLSPRAKFYSSLWLRNEPFDRHDWYVDRGDGTGLRRYVIDFYNGKEGTSQTNHKGKATTGLMGANGARGLPSMYLDVRPALDDLESAEDRMKMFLKDAFPGIYGLLGPTSGGNHSKK